MTDFSLSCRVYALFAIPRLEWPEHFRVDCQTGFSIQPNQRVLSDDVRIIYRQILNSYR